MAKIAIVAINIVIIIIASGCSLSSVNLPNSKSSLYVNTTGGLAVIDVNKLRLISQGTAIGENIFAIDSRGTNLFLSDAGITSVGIAADDYLYIVDTKQSKITKKINAPGVHVLIDKPDNVYGLYDDTLRFIYNKKNKKLRKYKLEAEQKLIGYLDDDPVYYREKRIWYRDKQLFLENEINHVGLFHKDKLPKLAVFAGEIYIVNLTKLKIEKRFDPVLRPDFITKPLIYGQKVYYSYDQADFRFNKFGVFDMLSGQNILISIKSEPSNVIATNEKLYFTFYYYNDVVVLSAKTHKVIKKIKIGSDPSGSILIKDKLFIANSGSGSISVIDTNKDVVVGTIRLGSDPMSFATSLPHTKATELGSI